MFIISNRRYIFDLIPNLTKDIYYIMEAGKSSNEVWENRLYYGTPGAGKFSEYF